MRRPLVLLVAVLLAVAGACSDDDDTTAAPSSSAPTSTTITTSTTTGVAADLATLIGRESTDGLPGWTHAAGAVVGDVHSVSFSSAAGGEHYVVLHRHAGHRPDGVAITFVLDVLAAGSLPPDGYFALPSDCRDADGELLEDVAALAAGLDPDYNPAMAAWRIDLDDEELIPLETVEGVTCWTGNPD